eukprot:1692124-Rhodomonas_salina.1
MGIGLVMHTATPPRMEVPVSVWGYQLRQLLSPLHHRPQRQYRQVSTRLNTRSAMPGTDIVYGAARRHFDARGYLNCPK